VAYDISTALFVDKEESLPADLKKLKEHQRRLAERYLQDKSEEVRARGLVVRTAAKAEDAREAICHYAAEEEIDVIIMNSGGRPGWMRWLTGSITEEVLRRAPCPVLILRPTQPTPTKE
jgi:nucleotide-binding universal stress UspA family protein